MAVAVPLSWMPPELTTQITTQDLHFVKKQGFNPYSGGFGSYSAPDPESVDLFTSVGEHAYLPYAYTVNLVRQGLLPTAVLKPIPRVPDRTCSQFFGFTGQLFEVQQPMVNQAYAQLIQHGTTSLNVYTGAGKTVMVSYLLACLSMLGQTSIIFLTSLTLIAQWKDTFDKFTNAVVWTVGEPFPNRPVNVILCMNERFKNLSPDYTKSIGVVVYDEAHTFCTEKRVPCLLGITPTFVIAASATMHRPDEMIGMMHAVVGEHKVYKISTKPFNVYKYNTGIEIPILTNAQGKPDWNKVLAAQCDHEQRNQLICDLAEQHRSDKILIMCKYVRHVKLLYNILKEKGWSVDHMSGTKKKYNDSQILIGTISKIGTGFDEKAACEDFNGFRINVLILTCSIKSIGLLEQVAGRSFRSDFPQIYYLVDQNRIVENHWRGAIKWFKSRNGTIRHIDSPYASGRKVERSKQRNEQQQKHVVNDHLEQVRAQLGAATISITLPKLLPPTKK